MYGENEVNDYHLIKYSLLHDFYLYFSSLNIFGLPLAQCLTGRFLLHIQPFVDLKRNNPAFISRIRNQKQFQTMGEINEILSSVNAVTQVPLKKSKKSILLSSDYYDFAADQLKEYEVSFYGVLYKEYESVSPSDFKHYFFQDEILKVSGKMVSQQIQLLKKMVEKHFKTSPAHYYFSTSLFRQWFLNAITGIIKWVYILDQLVLKTKPAVIIDPAEASIFGTILGLLSKKYHIPFINMPLLLVGDRAVIPSRADYYFVWGEFQRNWFIERNFKENRVIQTGNIKFYYEGNKPVCSRDELLKMLSIPSDHLMAGITTQPFIQTNHVLEEWLATIDEDLPVTLIVKKHRNDKYGYRLLERKKNVRIIDSDMPLYNFLKYLDVLMTVSSNTAIEAAIIDVPLFILQPEIPYNYQLNHNSINAHLAEAKAGEIIRNAEELVQALSNLLKDADYSKQLIEMGKTFLSKTLLSVNQAPTIAKRKIDAIIQSNM